MKVNLREQCFTQYFKFEIKFIRVVSLYQRVKKYLELIRIAKLKISHTYFICLMLFIPEQRLRWFHILNWLLHTVAFDIALLVTILYWALLSGSSRKENAFSINNHALNCIVMVFDLFVSNIPERLLHVVHSFTFAIVYITFLVLLHASGINSSVYPVTNWSTNPWLAAGMCIGAAFSTLVLRCLAFFLFKLRVYTAKKTGTFWANSRTREEHLAAGLVLKNVEETKGICVEKFNFDSKECG